MAMLEQFEWPVFNIILAVVVLLGLILFVFQFLCFKTSYGDIYFILNVPRGTLKRKLNDHLHTAAQAGSVELVNGLAVATFDHELNDKEWMSCEKFDGHQLILLHVLSNTKLKYRANIGINIEWVVHNSKEKTLSVIKPAYQCLLLRLIEEQCGQHNSVNRRQSIIVDMDTFHTLDEKQSVQRRGTIDRKLSVSDDQRLQHSHSKTDTLNLEEYLYLYIVQYHKEEFDHILHKNQGNHLVTYKYKSGSLEIRGEEHLVSNVVEGIGQLSQRVSSNLDNVMYNPPKGTDAEAFKLEAAVKVMTTMKALMIPKGDGTFQLYGQKGELQKVVQKLNDFASELHTNETDVFEIDQKQNVESKSKRIKIKVMKGNLIEQETEVLVVTGNKMLKFDGGSAKAIATAAGPQLIIECRDYLKKNGPLKVAQAMHTNAGNLPPPIKYVIHIVAPNSDDYPILKEREKVLEETFFNCLNYANDILSASSISVPAISSGILGVHKSIVAKAAHAAVKQYQLKKEPTLQIINFVDIDNEAIDALMAEFHGRKSNFGSENIVNKESDRNEKDEVLRRKSVDASKGKRK